jgi:hypothetical protein
VVVRRVMVIIDICIRSVGWSKYKKNRLPIPNDEMHPYGTFLDD